MLWYFICLQVYLNWKTTYLIQYHCQHHALNPTSPSRPPRAESLHWLCLTLDKSVAKVTSLTLSSTMLTLVLKTLPNTHACLHMYKAKTTECSRMSMPIKAEVRHWLPYANLHSTLLFLLVVWPQSHLVWIHRILFKHQVWIAQNVSAFKKALETTERHASGVSLIMKSPGINSRNITTFKTDLNINNFTDTWDHVKKVLWVHTWLADATKEDQHLHHWKYIICQPL